MPRKIRERWEKEINRAKAEIEERKMVDSEGLIAEKTLEIFHIPRSASEIEFLRLAEEKNCLPEALTAIYLMATREGEPRTGINLYAQGIGLLLWNSEWKARVKARVWALQQKLKTGCQDDLDFVIKLAFCFWKAQEEELAEKWADYYFINYQVLRGILDDVKDLLDSQYRINAEEEARNLNPKLIERVRSVMESVWYDRIGNLKAGEPITYLVAGKVKVGAVSTNCTGNWQEKKQAIVAAAGEEEAIIDGYPQKIPTASFMVQLSGQVKEEDLANLLPKQISIEDFGEEEKETPNFDKKKGDTLEVKIHQVMRDPIGKGGWIVAQTREGLEIPIEMSEMSLFPWGPGIEKLQGQTLNLTIKDIDESGFPQLSNIAEILEELRKLREEILESEKTSKVSQRNFIELPGFVAEISEEEERAIAVVPREKGILHPFEVAQAFVPESSLKNLRIGEEIIVRLFGRTDKAEIPTSRLTDEELKYCFDARIRKVRITYGAKAEISWSVIQYMRRSKDYDIRNITIRFIGKGGQNIKSLIGQEKGRVKIQGFTVTVSTQSENSRRIICRRVSKWFKDELDITLKWTNFQESEEG